jgi:hypothetical protein
MGDWGRNGADHQQVATQMLSAVKSADVYIATGETLSKW